MPRVPTRRIISAKATEANTTNTSSTLRTSKRQRIPTTKALRAGDETDIDEEHVNAASRVPKKQCMATSQAADAYSEASDNDNLIVTAHRPKQPHLTTDVDMVLSDDEVELPPVSKIRNVAVKRQVAKPRPISPDLEYIDYDEQPSFDYLRDIETIIPPVRKKTKPKSTERK
jgi:hypothetical protein